jgi:hypothetical protein
MKILKLSLLLIFSVVTFFGCMGNNTGNKPIVEPAGSADYYINNKSSFALNVVYTRQHSQVDSSKKVPADTSIKVLRDGGFGINPTPSTSFSKIICYKDTKDTSKAVLTINPVKDDKWNIIEKKGFENSDYGYTKYELVITDDDLN